MKVLLYAVFKDRRNATLALPDRNHTKFESSSEGRSLKAEQCSLTTRHLFEGCRRVEPASVGTPISRSAQTTLERRRAANPQLDLSHKWPANPWMRSASSVVDLKYSTPMPSR
jgi:hypothetical protein